MADTSAAPEEFHRLTPALVDQVNALAVRAAAVDGTPPLSEDARIALREVGSDQSNESVHLVLREAGALIGYAQVGGSQTATLELVVDPEHRGAGLGTSLLNAAVGATSGRPASAARTTELRAWSHGDSPAAAALAARSGWRRTRELWRMGRSLAASDELPAVELPGGVLLRPFEVGRDESAWLDLNARAFATHPEQGRWTAADLRARRHEAWFRAEDLLLAIEVATGALVASHWTKVEELPGSEVYVVAVDPSTQGRGLGRAIVLAGLHHLRRRGAQHVDLYVEGDNARARALYTRLGFERTGLDVQYSLP